MGYTGGTRPERPWYHDIGDHTEALEVVFDPEVIAYSRLLEVFWSAHDPLAGAHSRQYLRAVYVHNDAQARSVAESLASIREEAARLGGQVQIQTPALPAEAFFVAEDYHQKYLLQQDRILLPVLRERFADFNAFRDSTLAARVNGHMSGHGVLDEARLDAMNLPPRARGQLLERYTRVSARRRAAERR